MEKGDFQKRFEAYFKEELKPIGDNGCALVRRNGGPFTKSQTSWIDGFKDGIAVGLSKGRT